MLVTLQSPSSATQASYYRVPGRSVSMTGPLGATMQGPQFFWSVFFALVGGAVGYAWGQKHGLDRAEKFLGK